MFKKYIEINNYPLLYGPLEEQVLETLPKSTTLNLGYDNNLNIITLDVDNNLENILEETYKAGSNPSVALGKGAIQSRILESLVNEIKSFAVDKKEFFIVEIGCGEGRLLQALNKNDWIVKGFEIAPTAEVAKELSGNGIEIVNDFYTHDKVKELSDMIFSYCVLEHITELEEFFLESYKGLKNNGIFCHVVPDCEGMLKQGNIRILSHQHVNYFTKDSLMNLYRKFGFTNVGYKIIKPGNALMVYGYKKEETKEEIKEDTLTKNIVNQFSNNLTSSMDKLNTYLDTNLDKKIVFYSGGMQEYQILNRQEDIIFTNGDSELFGKKFYLNLPVIINPQLLKDMDIDIVVIFASHYYKEIEEYLLNTVKVSHKVRIISIDQITS